MSPKAKSDARQRIIETAEQLFYTDGVRSVGIDRIIEEAAVAKMTLYNHFASKDDLILAALEYREEKFDRMFSRWMRCHTDDGLNRLDAFFAALKTWFDSPRFRGCAFINAAVELADAKHPASVFSAAHKVRFHDMLGEIIVASKGAKAKKFVPAVALLVEGAIVAAVMRQTSAPADEAQAATSAVLANLRKRRKH